MSASDSAGLEIAGDPSAPRVAWLVHGILGRGRNFRTLGRRIASTWPSFRVLLPDLRCHGESPPRSPPHDLAATARDLQELASRHGAPQVVVGHSFGGKAVLAWARDHGAGSGAIVWSLDSPPGPVLGRASREQDADPARILSLLQKIPLPAPSRDALRQPLKEAGLPEPIVQWLLTSAVQAQDGWRWLWDLDGVESLLRSYADTDLWPWLEDPPAGAPEVHLVRAGRSDRWSPEDLARFQRMAERGRGHVLPDAGHWLHVDDPEGLWRLLSESFEGAG